MAIRKLALLAAVVATLGIGAAYFVQPAKADCATQCDQNTNSCFTHCW